MSTSTLDSRVDTARIPRDARVCDTSPASRVRRDDRARRHRPHAAVSHSRVQNCDDRRHRRGAVGVERDLLGAASLHGYPGIFSRRAGAARRDPRFPGWRADREFVEANLSLDSSF